MKLSSRKILIEGLTLFIFAIGFFGLVNQVFAANCGNSIDPTQNQCHCGDTVIASTTLTSNLTCIENGLIIGADNITVDGNNYSIAGNQSGEFIGIYI